jgi:hypothetical protein
MLEKPPGAGGTIPAMGSPALGHVRSVYLGIGGPTILSGSHPQSARGSGARVMSAWTSSFTCGSWRTRPESNAHRDSNCILQNAC